MRSQLVVRIIIMVALCLGVGFVSGFFQKDSVSGWYASLTQPMFNPPSWAFGIVWPILYVLMGIAAGILWSKPIGFRAVHAALKLFLFQLILNGLWMPLFFGLQRIDLALFEIILLWIMILITTIVFYVQSKPAGLLLVPYLLWISFAVYLNAGYWFLNR